MAKMKVTPDAELPTVAAIEFRIESLRKELAHNPRDLTVFRRIEALKKRLPKDPNAPIIQATNAALLASKSQVDEYNGRVSLYNSECCSY